MLFLPCEDAYPTGAPGPYSQFLAESEQLIYFVLFSVRVLFVIFCSLQCLSIFFSWCLFPDCRFFVYRSNHGSLDFTIFQVCLGPGGSMSQVAGSNNSYKPITNTAWVRARLCKLQKKGALDWQPQVIKFTCCLPWSVVLSGFLHH